jgi:hypothetical protein
LRAPLRFYHALPTRGTAKDICVLSHRLVKFVAVDGLAGKQEQLESSSARPIDGSPPGLCPRCQVMACEAAPRSPS